MFLYTNKSALKSVHSSPLPGFFHKEAYHTHYSAPCLFHSLFLEMFQISSYSVHGLCWMASNSYYVDDPVYSTRILLTDTWAVHLGVSYKFKEPTSIVRRWEPTDEWRRMSSCPRSALVCHWQRPQPLWGWLLGESLPSFSQGSETELREKHMT